MKQRKFFSLVTVLVLILGLGILPTTAFADGGDEVVESEVVELPLSASDLVGEANSERGDLFWQQRSLFAWDTAEPHWMWIVARNAVWGGMLGGLIGFGVYLVTGLEWNPWTIAQFAGGGILVGAGTGLIEAAFWADGADEDASNATPASVDWVLREMPTTYEVPVFRLEF